MIQTSLVGCFPGDPVEPGGGGTFDVRLPEELFLATAPVAAPSLGGSGSARSVERAADRSQSAPTVATGDAPARPARESRESREARSAASGADHSLPAIGSVIDKYRIEELLGTGAFAAVYRATHLLLRIPVALKLLKPRVLRQRPLLAGLLCEEARFAAQLNHPNVVRVFDVTHNPKITYIVMEFIEGESLHQAVRRKGRLRALDAVDVGIDITRGLLGALDQGLIHRDIKPANILLARSGVAKIVDLGLAQQADDESRARATDSGRMVVGTPMYMAPEQASRPEDVDFRADVYSLGATLYHAVTGRPPFDDEKPIDVLARHQKEPVRPPDQVAPDVPFELSRLLMWMLEKEREKRPDYGQLLVAFDEVRQVAVLEDGIADLLR
ncbi:MAG: serine/threonine-protein kinase [Vicinamibacteria bacterium]